MSLGIEYMDGLKYMLIRFWIRDGEREYNQFVICNKDNFPHTYIGNDGRISDFGCKQLIKMYISDDATEYEDDDWYTNMYWVYDTEALCRIERCHLISHETKELLNNMGVYYSEY